MREVEKNSQGKMSIGKLVLIVFIILFFAYTFYSVNQPIHHTPPTCTNNLKNYTAALHGYVTDWSGIYPTRYMGTSPEALDQIINPGRPGWIYNAVRPYMKNQAIFTCPEIPNDTTGAFPIEPTKTYLASYAYNYARLNYANDADIDRSADTVMMWDSLNNYFEEQANVGWSEDTRSIGDIKKVDIKATIRSAISKGGDIYNFCSKTDLDQPCNIFGSPADSELGKRVVAQRQWQCSFCRRTCSSFELLEVKVGSIVRNRQKESLL